MTSTRKGERRKQALIAAAAELMREGGLEAVRHRAVAQRAGLPLAATTYYFESLDSLIVSAAEAEAAQTAERITSIVAGVARRSRSASRIADLFAEVFIDSEGAASSLAWHYEQSLVVVRNPELRDVHAGLRSHIRRAISDLLDRSGRAAEAPAAEAVEAVLAGAVVISLPNDSPGAAAAAQAILARVIDHLAPPV